MCGACGCMCVTQENTITAFQWCGDSIWSCKRNRRCTHTLCVRWCCAANITETGTIAFYVCMSQFSSATVYTVGSYIRSVGNGLHKTIFHFDVSWKAWNTYETCARNHSKLHTLYWMLPLHSRWLLLFLFRTLSHSPSSTVKSNGRWTHFSFECLCAPVCVNGFMDNGFSCLCSLLFLCCTLYTNWQINFLR